MGAAKDLSGAFSLAMQILERAATPRPAPRAAEPPPGPDPVWGSPAARCMTCGDTFKVGQPGYEVPCPSCVVVASVAPSCRVCSGTGKVGARGHKVACPVCRA